MHCRRSNVQVIIVLNDLGHGPIKDGNGTVGCSKINSKINRTTFAHDCSFLFFLVKKSLIFRELCEATGCFLASSGLLDELSALLFCAARLTGFSETLVSSCSDSELFSIVTDCGFDTAKSGSGLFIDPSFSESGNSLLRVKVISVVSAICADSVVVSDGLE